MLVYGNCMHVDILHYFRGRLPEWRHDGLPRPYWRVYWNETPGWSVLHEGVEWQLRPDRILLIAPETVYQGLGRGPSEHFFLHATGDGMFARARPAVHALPCTGGIAELCREMGSRTDDAHWRMLTSTVLLWSMARSMDRLNPPSPFSPPITAAMNLGERHLHRRMDNSALARAAGMHLCSFIRRFRQETGLTPQEWHQRQRISRACIALEDRDASIDDIAAGHGFCDRHHFSRVFRQLRGIAPAAYRRSAARRQT